MYLLPLLIVSQAVTPLSMLDSLHNVVWPAEEPEGHPRVHEAVMPGLPGVCRPVLHVHRPVRPPGPQHGQGLPHPGTVHPAWILPQASLQYSRVHSVGNQPTCQAVVPCCLISFSDILDWSFPGVELSVQVRGSLRPRMLSNRLHRLVG